ncbi:LysR family transcriptional regulator [Marinomonas sp. C2222]|uniref:LysR family transcriptional regulator n=1 Tax=Marinomonas sargassi TaxID=2984494 RepID=A0ABT2YUD2_9GAMM|nr:LysR family transcriptional regulator [Marinomonas sargassi]MCV2403515.1 LysR family transcriptional regulator [Marinomonas sargassi]
MNLDHIKIFLAVYRAKSFTLVAKDLDVAASSISRAIATLEGQLKIRLFQRTTRNLAPTQAGIDYFHRIQPLFDELECVNQEITDNSSEPSGSLRITASISFGQIVLTPLLKEFLQKYPKVTPEITLSDSRDNIITEQFDIAIRQGKLSDSSLVARKLIDVKYLLVASPTYLEQAAPIQCPEEIMQHPLITFSYSGFNKEWYFKQDDQIDTIAIRPILTLTTASAIKTCVTKGMGLTILPEWSIQDEILSRELVEVLPDWAFSGLPVETGVWLMYPSRAFIPAKTAAFMNFLLDKVG